jgi:MFS family permease
VSAALTDRVGYGELLRRPGYREFVLTVSLSRVSVTMFGISGVLLVLSRTGSAPLAGATAAAAVLPAALSGPLLGAWLEVAQDRRVLIVADQMLSIIGLLAILALAGHAPGWTVLAAAAAYGITRPLSAGSFQAAIAQLSGPELLDHASTIEASSLNASFVVGPALAGALAGATSPAVAILVQIGLTVVVAALIAVNPVFDARPEHRVASVGQAVREGLSAIGRNRVLRATTFASVLAALGWGLMSVTFPLYAAGTLHAGAHAGGYLWAAVAGGSLIGTFALRGRPTLRRVALSYGVLGVSALLWPFAGTLAVGILLIGLTGFLEGPAYSGTIALRQRHAPPAVRAQVMTTLNGTAMVAVSAGAAIGGAVHDPIPTIIAFCVINLVASAVATGRLGGTAQDIRDHGAAGM